MFEKVKNKFNDIKEENKKRLEERATIARERAEEEAREERKRVQTEKDALMALNEKELMAEIIMALREYNTRLNNIKEQQDDLKDKIQSLELSMNSIHSNISSISSSVDELKYK